MNFFDVSTAADLIPVAAVLSGLKRNAAQLGIDVMVVGAVARDILIRHVAGVTPARATADIDIGIAVTSWSEVDLLGQTMQPVPGNVHRFLVGQIEVDVIPFGEIESNQRTITWSNDHMMDVFGFREAFESAVSVRLPGDLEIAVASLPAQSLLKLFAWRDRRYQDRRDAIDLKTILHSFHQGKYFDELYDRHLSLLEKLEFDPRLAGAAKMGHEAKNLIATSDQSIATDLLSDDDLLQSLASDMGGRQGDNLALLLAYRGGFA